MSIKQEIKKYLTRNTKLIVSLTSQGNYYDSRVEDIDNSRIVISMPSRKGRPVQVVLGSVLNLSVITENGRITFDTKVIDVVKHPLQMLCLTLPETIRHEQLRQFYRIPVSLRVQVFLGNMELMKTTANTTGLIPMEDASIDDLSGGGCKIHTTTPLKEGDTIVIDFISSLPEAEKIEGKVVRIIETQNTKNSASIRFSEIPEQVRDKIVRFVFRKQMEQRNLIQK